MTPAELLHTDAARYATNRKNAYIEKMKLKDVDHMSEDALNGRWLAHYEGYREGYWVATGDTTFSTDPAKLVATKAIAELESQEPFPPAQRTWIGLTDDEFNELYDRYVPLTCYALLIEKVEAKLKEKNT